MLQPYNIAALQQHEIKFVERLQIKQKKLSGSLPMAFLLNNS